jgi:DNA-binding HxlR family transcriptional regulator
VQTSRGSEQAIPHVPPAKRHPYDQWSPDARALDLVGDKWTLLIVRDLMSGPRRFVELQRVLPGISTEQLRSRLNRMVADGMLTRKRYREVPPRVDYELTARARELAPVLGELARWGYEWSWGPPRPAESVDIGAIFRLIPGLVDRGSTASGTIDLTVEDGREGGPAAYQVRFAPGRAAISEGADATPDARLSGTLAAWIGALGPAREHSGLQATGNQRLTSAVLDVLSHGRDSGALAVSADTAGD